MRCEEIRTHLSAFLDGELDAHRRRLVDEHLRRCPDCQAAVRALEETIAMLQQAPGVNPDVLSTHAILDRLPVELGRIERATTRAALAVVAVGVAAAGGVVTLGLALTPVTMLFHLLRALFGLVHHLVFGGPPPSTTGAGFGTGVIGATAAAFVLNGLARLAVRRW